MIAWLIEFSLRQKGFVLALAGAAILAGVWSASRLPLDAVPDVTNVQVQVNTEVTALAPEEIEGMVTIPLEIELVGIQGLVEMRSLSKFGLSQQTLIFEDDADMDRARQYVAERLQGVREHLPAGLNPQMAPISTGLGEIYFYTVDYEPGATNKAADRVDQLRELTQVQEWIVKPALRTVPGVAEVTAWGGYDRQIVIEPDPEKLRNIGMSFSALAGLVAENVENAGGGAIELGGERVMIRSLGRIRSIEDIAKLPLKFGPGVEPIRLGEVAEVVIGSGVRTGAATEGGEEAVLGVVLMVSGENSRVVARRVQERIEEVGGRLPAGIEIRPCYNRSELVGRTARTVGLNLAEGAMLVMAVLFLLLGNARAALIVASAIPLSMLLALTGMVQSRVSGNLMSLGAIDFGLIVDGAVVMVENALRRMGERQRQLGRLLTAEERGSSIVAACREVGPPMAFGVMIITVVYVPILALTGIEGKMFKPMALTVIFALTGALLLALTVVPALCSIVLRGRVAEEDNRLMRGIKRRFRPVLEWSLAHRAATVGLALAPWLVALWMFPRLGAEFVPKLDEGSMVIQMVRANSIALGSSIEMQRKAERAILAGFPEVTHIYSRIGTPDVATDPMGLNVSDTYLTLAPRERWRKVEGRPITKDELARSINDALSSQVPGQANLFTQPIEMRFNEMLEGSRADVAIKIFGDDFDLLEGIATQVRDLAAEIPGAAEIAFESVGKSPNLEVIPDLDAMARYNLHGAELNRLVTTALAGEQVGLFFEGERRYPIVVRMPGEARSRTGAIEDLPVCTDEGGLLALRKVARLSVVERVNTVTREGGRRRVVVQVNLRGRDVDSFVREARGRFEADVELPGGYVIEFGGQFKNLQLARARLAVVVPLAMGLILLLLFAAFGNVRQGLMVYTGIPIAVTGGVFALALRGMPFSISAAVGFIAVSGVAVLNGVVLISYFNQLVQAGRAVSEAVREGTETRLRPVLMTALVAGLGFVPMAVSAGAGAEVQRPLATVVIGGILTSSLLTLVLIPMLYEWVESGRAKRSSAPS